MAGIGTSPPQYLAANTEQTKNIVVVVEIPGLDLLSSRPIGTRIRYGDPGLVYGGAGLIYGGLRPVTGVRDLLSLDGSSLTIQQKLEPEQGRGSVTTLSVSFIDKDQYMTQACSPGVLIPDILGSPVRIYLGYEDISFPEDYEIIFRGRVTSIDEIPGRYTLQFSDYNVNRRGEIFFSAQSTLSGAINDSVTTIPLVSNADFHKKILGPDGSYDTTVSCFVQIEDEWIEYQQTGHESDGFGTNQFLHVIRGSRGTTAAAHDIATAVAVGVQLQGNPMIMALKLMLSGWDGPYLSDVPLLNLAFTGDLVIGNPTNVIVLPSEKDAERDYGLSVGDFVTITGAISGSNDLTGAVITLFGDLDDEPGRLIYLDQNFVSQENPTTAVMAVRSQYDTYPTTCGTKLEGDSVDVSGHKYLFNTFLSQEEFRFFITNGNTSKTFIESQLYLPVAAYSITRKGRLSVGLTTPPIADERLQILDSSNVLDPKNIRVQRATNNRKYYNEIDWQYDYDDAGTATQLQKFLDSESLSIIGILSVLPISSMGGRTDLNFLATLTERSRFLLNRYGRGAQLIMLKVNYGVGNLIEGGDVVLLKDDGELQIPNFTDGVRNLGSQLFEVQDRQLDIKGGIVSLTLVSGLGVDVQDKFATWGPSSIVGTGSTTSRIKIINSYGTVGPVEFLKWTAYFGNRIRIHSADFTYDQTTVLLGFDPGDTYAMLVDPPVTGVPSSGCIVDQAEYTTTDPHVDAASKLINCFWDPNAVMTGVTSTTVFAVSSGDAAKFQLDQPVYFHKADYTVNSSEARVVDITGTTITVDPAFDSLPVTGDIVELIGFADGGPPYRFI